MAKQEISDLGPTDVYLTDMDDELPRRYGQDEGYRAAALRRKVLISALFNRRVVVTANNLLLNRQFRLLLMTGRYERYDLAGLIGAGILLPSFGSETQSFVELFEADIKARASNVSDRRDRQKQREYAEFLDDISRHWTRRPATASARFMGRAGRLMRDTGAMHALGLAEAVAPMRAFIERWRTEHGGFGTTAYIRFGRSVRSPVIRRRVFEFATTLRHGVEAALLKLRPSYAERLGPAALVVHRRHPALLPRSSRRRLAPDALLWRRDVVNDLTSDDVRRIRRSDAFVQYDEATRKAITERRSRLAEAALVRYLGDLDAEVAPWHLGRGLTLEALRLLKFGVRTIGGLGIGQAPDQLIGAARDAIDQGRISQSFFTSRPQIILIGVLIWWAAQQATAQIERAERAVLGGSTGTLRQRNVGSTVVDVSLPATLISRTQISRSRR